MLPGQEQKDRTVRYTTERRLVWSGPVDATGRDPAARPPEQISLDRGLDTGNCDEVGANSILYARKRLPYKAHRAELDWTGLILPSRTLAITITITITLTLTSALLILILIFAPPNPNPKILLTCPASPELAKDAIYGDPLPCSGAHLLLAALARPSTKTFCSALADPQLILDPGLG
ncbi:hypothetical protein CFAM422_010344 [Trichoderma lentiforme]|uniref:Uncharacterized protein n=1 Tax=Trichoderma lentiforme TaxID=1567552 RepID=A0A9P4X7V1_9HYPO|nr:hypothetical protein CFAM422_010344 [Trichoderma lentiforme]